MRGAGETQTIESAMPKRQTTAKNAMPWACVALCVALQGACDSGGNAVNDRTPDTGNNFQVSAIVDVDLTAARTPLAVGAAVGTPVGITAFASDEDRDNNAVSYTLVDNASGQFTIDPASGVVSVNGALTLSAPGAPHRITVQATSADGSTSRATFDIRVEPPNTGPVSAISDSDSAPDQVGVDAPIGTPVGITISANDPDAHHTVSYTLSGSAAALLTLDADGVVQLAAVPMTTGTVRLTVVARSTDGSSSMATYDITVLPALIAPSVTVQFPARIGLTTGATVNFIGTAVADSGSVGPVTVTVTVTVGSTKFTTAADTASPFQWRIDNVPLTTGTVNELTVQATDGNGERRTLNHRITQFSVPPPIEIAAPVGLVLDATNSRLLVVDVLLDGVVAVDLLSGLRTVLSSDDRGMGPELTTPSGAATLDATNNRLLIMDSDLDSMVAIALDTGARTVLSSDDVGTGPSFRSSNGLALDPSDANRAFVSDGSSNDAIFAVDLRNGNRTVISDDDTGAGPSLNTPRGIVLSADGASLLALSSGLDALLAVDLSNGNRRIISRRTAGGGGVGTGPGFGTPRFMALDRVRNRVLMTDSGVLDALLAVDLSNGNRTVLSGSSGTALIGAGIDFDDPRGIVLADSDTAYVSDNGEDGIFQVDLRTGDRTLIPIGTLTSALAAGPSLSNPRGIALDGTQNPPRLLLADDGLNAVVAIDLNTGDRSIIADRMHGQAFGMSEFAQPRSIGLDPANQRALVADATRDALLEIDLRVGPTLGDRRVLSDDDSGAVNFASPRGTVALLGDGTALIADTAADALFRVTLSDGARTALVRGGPNLEGIQDVAVDRSQSPPRIAFTVSTSADGVLDAGVVAVTLSDASLTVLATTTTVGSGPIMTNPRGVAWDVGNGRSRLLVMDADLDALIALDPATMIRGTVSDSRNGDMLEANGTSNALAVDAQNDRAWIISQDNDRVVLVHLITGDQIIISE